MLIGDEGETSPADSIVVDDDADDDGDDDD